MMCLVPVEAGSYYHGGEERQEIQGVGRGSIIMEVGRRNGWRLAAVRAGSVWL